MFIHSFISKPAFNCVVTAFGAQLVKILTIDTVDPHAMCTFVLIASIAWVVGASIDGHSEWYDESGPGKKGSRPRLAFNLPKPATHRFDCRDAQDDN
jgi:hypothetical protein